VRHIHGWWHPGCMHVERGRDKRRQMEKLTEDWKKKDARRPSHVL
jgi:hypothetical protein